ncbi:MAG: hypothetical protein HND53_09180 [Proteobacteria bacterium]|nr:YcxB family protein [Pseudomonadota bacterium]NOG60658.1 hypothetical protein [Pseudomonadota bacterium]
MNLNVTVTKEDFLLFNKVASKKIYSVRNLSNYYHVTNIIHWVFFGLGVAALLHFYEDFRYSDLIQLNLALIFLGIWFVFGLVKNNWLYKAYLDRMVDDDKTTIGNFTFIFNQNGVIEKSEFHETTYYWNCISDIVLESNLLILFSETGKGMLIPIKEISNEEKDKLASILLLHKNYKL